MRDASAPFTVPRQQRMGFSESSYFQKFKTLRNRLREYAPHSILNRCLDYINSPADDGPRRLQKLPWIAFLLIKWAYVDHYALMPSKRDASEGDVRKLIEMVNELSSNMRMPTQYSALMLFLRNIAFQQFLFQQEVSAAQVGRQALLFGSLEANHRLRRRFVEITSIDLNCFLSLAVCLLSRVLVDRQRTVSSEWFSPLYSIYGKLAIDCFLKSLSVSITNLRSFFCSLYSGKHKSSEPFEQTPLIFKPMIGDENTAMAVYPEILFRCVEHFIYDTLRNDDPEKFMDRFGPIFENYIERGLMYCGAQYTNEKYIKSIYGANVSTVDFLVREGESNIFIDAKGVQMSDVGMTTHSATILKDRVKTTILKAIQQAHALNQRIFSDPRCAELSRAAANYIVVVTYKPLYLGNGSAFYDAIAGEALAALLAECDDIARIPYENMYFFTVEEFDILIEAIQKEKTSFVEFLETAKTLDLNPTTKKFDFILHLRSRGFETPPRYVIDSFERIVPSF